MEWSIQQIAGAAGITSRTLRHYDQIGLLVPARVGDNGYRYYDDASLVRLQRILLLRELGLGLPEIADVLDGQVADAEALETHVRWLEQEAGRIRDQILAVTATIAALQKGESLMPEHMFHGFDPSQYRTEVAERWGPEAAARSEQWWAKLGSAGQQEFQGLHRALQDDYDAAILAGELPEGTLVQAIAARHAAWIAAGWQGRRPGANALRGLADMYVGDPRFAKNYTRVDPKGAEFVRAALHAFAASQPAE